MGINKAYYIKLRQGQAPPYHREYLPYFFEIAFLPDSGGRQVTSNP